MSNLQQLFARNYNFFTGSAGIPACWTRSVQKALIQIQLDFRQTLLRREARRSTPGMPALPAMTLLILPRLLFFIEHKRAAIY